VPLAHAAAQSAAVARAESAARAQIRPEYSAVFVPASYSGGTLPGKFTVSNGGDSAADDTERTIAVIPADTAAADELAKNNVPLMSVTVPLNAGGAVDEAAAAVTMAAQKQVTPGYTVTFGRAGDTVAYGMLSGRFTITNGPEPSDTAADAADRTIGIRYTTAAEVLKNIVIPSVTIDIPVTITTLSARKAGAQVAAVAQARAAPGYLVTFGFDYSYANDYRYYGECTGTLTAVNENNPSDRATDAASRTIAVNSAYPYNAMDELYRIIFDDITIAIDLPLSAPGAVEAAATAIASEAEWQITFGSKYEYNVSFVPSGEISADATLKGRFTVTNDDYPVDTATDKVERTIRLISPVMRALESINSTLHADINLPRNHPDAPGAAVPLAISAAQQSIRQAGFSVVVTALVLTEENIVNGELRGRFTVADENYPTDTATDTSDRTVIMTTPAIRNINNIYRHFYGHTFAIPVPVNDAGALEAAVSVIEAEAYATVGDECTISFAPTGNIVINEIDPRRGRIPGIFTVTNKTYPNDDTETVEETVSVHHY
jgi:hypothetical protein